MFHRTLLTALCIVIMTATLSLAQNSAFLTRNYVDGTGTYLYYVHVPRNYSHSVKYPVVVFLHGGGGYGQIGRPSLTWTDDTNESRNPCFVLQPNMTSGWANGFNLRVGVTTFGTETNVMNAAMAELDSMQREYSIDTNRIYVTGLSNGASGTWDVAERFPNRFAAIVPLSGAGDPTKAALLANLPVWAFHADSDKTVNVYGSRSMVSALETYGRTAVRVKCGYSEGCVAPTGRSALVATVNSGATLLYTEWLGAGHGGWDYAFDDPLLHTWLFKQSRGGGATPARTETRAAASQMVGQRAFATIRDGRSLRVGQTSSAGTVALYDIRGKLVGRL
jgi:predicted peptidase